jgi:hypothetical protein
MRIISYFLGGFSVYTIQILIILYYIPFFIASIVVDISFFTAFFPHDLLTYNLSTIGALRNSSQFIYPWMKLSNFIIQR